MAVFLSELGVQRRGGGAKAQTAASFATAIVMVGLFLGGGCASDDEEDRGTGAAGGTRGIPEQTGSQCKAPSDCYPGLNGTTLRGAALCLDRVREGYCTHECETDADCCAVPGECKTGLRQVCSPFESTGVRMCFLSCEKEDLQPVNDAAAPDPIDEQEYCQREVSTSFICRSSGGGSDNRKICVPGDCGVGASCSVNADCDAEQICLTSFRGGYCGTKDCTQNADCPNDSLCVRHTDNVSYCLRACDADTDCSFCRSGNSLSRCTTGVTFVEPGTGSVCIPPS